MRILVISPGDGVSTIDVYNGLCHGFEAAGHEVIRYDMRGRMILMGSWLKSRYRQMRKSQPNFDIPTIGDVVYYASGGVLQKVAETQPDVVIVVSARYFPPYGMILLRRMGIFTGVLLTESPYDDMQQEKRAALGDIVWTTERVSVEPLRSVNPHTFYLRHAYDPERHYPGAEDTEDVPSHDVVFVGSGFNERIALLEGVDWSGIDLGLYGMWGNLRRRSPLRQYVREGPTPNARTAALYRNAKIGLNLYRHSREGLPVGESLNPRAYELAACGLFSISEYRPEVPETFGDLVPTFRTSRGLEEAVRSWLMVDGFREDARAQLPRVMEEHSFETRARQMVHEMEMVRAGIPVREAVPV